MPACKTCETNGNLGRTCPHDGVTHWDGCGNSFLPEHAGCKKRPDVPLRDTLWNEGYSVGVQDSMLRATQCERILSDLIAELRNNKGETIGHAGCSYVAAARIDRIADRAEARLRKITK